MCIIPFFVNSVVTSILLLAEVGEEVHLEGVGQLCRGLEREVDIVREDLGYIRTRDVHATEDAAEKGRGDMVNCGQENLTM